MKKHRGGQEKHWAEKARAWAWYSEVKKRTDWTDYRLDAEFAMKPEWRGSDVKNSNNKRIFEHLRTKARKPRKSGPWRSMIELVAAVDQHPLFAGTAKIYEAEFWGVLQEKFVTPQYAESRVRRILEANDLVWVPTMSEKGLDCLVGKHPIASIVDRCLRLSLRNLDKFSQLTLAWSLYQLAEPADNWSIRSMIEKIIDDRLDLFFAGFFPYPRHLAYYTDAVDALLSSRLDLSSFKVGGYGYFEGLMRQVVIPSSFQGVIQEGHLFART